MKNYHRILISVLISNILGALIVFFYFAYIDVQTYIQNQLFWRGTQADWTTFTVVLVLGSAATWLLGMLRARPLIMWEVRLQESQNPRKLPEKIRRWAVSFPLYLAAVSFGILTIIGIFFGQGGLMFASSDMQTFMRTFLGVGGVGGVTAFMLAFVLTDSQWRAHLPNFLFEREAKSFQVPRITVGMRLILTLSLTGFVPLVIIGIAGNNGIFRIMDPAIDPFDIISRLQTLIIFIVVSSLILNFIIGTFTTHSLVGPLKRLTRAMNQVGGGDLTSSLAIETSDEIGDLTFQFNKMVAELRDAQRMRDLFGRYVSKEVAAKVLDNGADLGGENISATTLFADIRDFTGLSERLPAQEVVNILNRYYTHMVDVIVTEGGLVNKFGGDSILAVFGAPIRQPDHALRAVRAAWQMTRALGEFNAEQIALGMPALTIGIGIASGEVVAGNVGSEARIEYTVIGDPVNLASRLQSLTKELGATVLLSENTQKELGEAQVDCHPYGEVPVRGKQEPISVFALQGLAGSPIS
ncbi:MAG: adenylate/guanylate cyclase domain-containing protein [Anaerolineales bacterium]|nr:adenylate/guanylate cyclase domain-containing protein [Chloroflexota bacterium]MBL6982017.1 adenylate/guanylate cyclase domain-containing protein [Anaerolineales bacterium]